MTAPSAAVTVLVLALLASCGADRTGATENGVRARFDAFERALRADDLDALLGLVTRESLPALEQVRPGTASARGALVVEAVRQRDPRCWEVDVREASSGTSGTFALVRENGAWRVDLVESAAVTHGTEAGAPTIEPAGLTPAQIDGIRANRKERVQ